jgi:hypothetical protein
MNAQSSSKPLCACSKGYFRNFLKECHPEYRQDGKIDIENDFMALSIS